MPRYKLLSAHYSEEDKLLDAGTIVGDNEEHRWTRPPTPEMEGLDDESRDLVEAETKRCEGRIDPIDGLSMTVDGSMLNHPAQRPTVGGVRGR